MQSNGYTIGFAAAVCVICALLLSGVSGALKPRVEKNRTLDRQKNILVALGWDKTEISKMSGDDVESTYAKGVEETVVDRAGKTLDKKIADLEAKTRKGENKSAQELPLYRRMDDPSKLAFAYPVTGKGLWSTLYGYLAVKPSGNEIVGLSFYKHGETPGLGAEIEQAWFTKNFVGKELYDDNKLVGIEVVKGKAADKPSFKKNADHMVDGISGATLTGNGVMKMTRVEPLRYVGFFKNQSKNRKRPTPPKPTPIKRAPEGLKPAPGSMTDLPGTAPAADGGPTAAAPTDGSIVVKPVATNPKLNKRAPGELKPLPKGLSKEQMEAHLKEVEATRLKEMKANAAKSNPKPIEGGAK